MTFLCDILVKWFNFVVKESLHPKDLTNSNCCIVFVRIFMIYLTGVSCFRFCNYFSIFAGKRNLSNDRLPTRGQSAGWVFARERCNGFCRKQGENVLGLVYKLCIFWIEIWDMCFENSLLVSCRRIVILILNFSELFAPCDMLQVISYC